MHVVDDSELSSLPVSDVERKRWEDGSTTEVDNISDNEEGSDTEKE